MNFEIYCSGMFNRRVVIEQQTLTPDSFGQVHSDVQSSSGTWAEVITCWAKITPIWGQELQRSGRDVAETWVTIDLRYGSGKDVEPKMRVRDKSTGERYDIRTVMHVDSAKKVIELTCLKVQ